MYSHLFARFCGALRKWGLVLLLVGLGSSGVQAITITVTIPNDVVDANSGTCVSMTNAHLPGTDGLISLREAICVANKETSEDIIILSAVTYTLTISGSDDTNAKGDLDILATATAGKLTIEGNGATINGGAIDRVLHVLAGADLTIKDVTITNGSIADNGGGIRMEGDTNSKLTVINSTISGNKITDSAKNGGGISIGSPGALSITNGTITNNDIATGGTGAGGGIRTAGGTVALKNTIVAGNKKGTANNDCSGTISGNNNLVMDTTTCPVIGNTNTGCPVSIGTCTTDPKLDTLASVPPQTHALLAGNPAIDAGDDSAIPVGVTTDQRGTGFPRLLDGNGDCNVLTTTPHVDIGAYEYKNTAPTLATIPAVTLTTINEDPTTNNGDAINIAAITGLITDLDCSATKGIAVTAVDNTNGAWQYSFNGGAWTAFGTPSISSARLLSAVATNKIRFVPNANYNGGSGDLTFRAWDMTSGTDGGTADTTANGGSTAFSTATTTASVTVNAVNDVPSFTKGADKSHLAGTTGAQAVNGWATAINKGATNESGQTLTFDISITDTDNILTSLPAIDPTTGNLSYTLTGNAGTATLAVTLKDDGGTANGGVDTSASQSFTITVGSNTAPSFTSTALTTATVGSLYTYSITATDVDTGQTLTITAPTKPTWLTLTDNGDGTATLSGTPTVAGSDAIQLKVEDNLGGFALQNFTINITLIDIIPPSFSVTPTTKNITQTSFELVVQLNEIGKVYYVVLPAGSPAPTSAQVKAGKDSTDASVKNGNFDVTATNTDTTTTITGLTANTTYDIYIVAEDVLSNLQATPTKMTVKTASSGGGSSGGGSSGGGSSGGGTVTPPLDDTMKLYLNYGGLGTGQITLDPEPNIAGTSCDTVKGLCAYTFDTTTWVTLTAKADKESTFDYWGGSSYCRNGETQLSADKKTATLKLFMIYNISCTANFKLVQYNLTVTPSGDGTGTVSFSPNALACGENCRTYNSGTAVELTAQPAAGSTFNGWSGDCQGQSSTAQLKITKNSTCTAIFNQIPTYTLNVTTTGSGTVTTESQPDGTACGAGCTAYLLTTPAAEVKLTPVAALGSTFNNWTGDPDCADGNVTMATAKNCVANFTVIPAYTLTVTKAGDGTGQISRNPAGTAFCSQPPVAGGECSSYPISAAPAVVTLTATPAADSTFVGWKGDCSLDGKVTVNGNQQCVATFMLTATIPNYELTVTPRGTGQGTISLEPQGENCATPQELCSRYKMGSVVKVTATPTAGSTFKGWTGHCDNTGKVNMDANKQCIATFDAIPIYRLTTTPAGDGQVTISPVGMNCGNNGSQPVICNAYYLTDPVTTVMLTPVASPGSVFTGWTGDDDCQDNQVSLDTNKRCTANFNSFGLLKFSSAAYSVNEDAEFAVITVSRAGGTQGEISVTYQTADGTAVAGEDYVATTGLLTWAAGDSQDKTFVIPIVYDAVTELAETIQLSLTNPTGGALLDTISQAEVTIADVMWLPSSLQFSTPAYRANEGSGKVTLLVTRAGNHRGAIAINYATADTISDTTALANSDYTPQSGTLTWADGDMTHRVIEIPIAKDSLDEPEETFTVALSGLQGDAVLGEWQTATVTIINTPPAGNLQFSAASYTFGEGITAQIAVERVGGSAGSVAVEYQTRNGTAMLGNDYLAQKGTLAWADGDTTTQYITVPILTDNLTEDGEMLTIELANPTGYADLGSISVTTLNIVDRVEGNATGTLQFDPIRYEVSESGIHVQLIVTRSGGTQGEVTVDYATQDDTATADRDYVATSGQLHWAEGEMGEKSFTVNLLDDTLPETTEKFLVNLSNPSAGAKLGKDAQATVTVQDDDATIIQFSAIGYTVAENRQEVVVTVVRKGNPFGPVSVKYATADKTALAEQDYVQQAGTLTWFSNDAEPKQITIPIKADNVAEGWEEFTLDLSNVTEKGILGDPHWTTVVIDDNRNDCQVVNRVVDCFYYNPDVLENIRITPRGTVKGKHLKGTIQNQGQVQEVTLQANTRLYGGSIAISLTGPAGLPVAQRAVIDDTIIKPETQLSHVVIGRNSTVDSLAILGEGVLFEDNNTIPSIIDLAGILGRFEPAIPGQIGAVKLESDGLVNNAVGGILGAINGLYDLKNQGIVITQNPSNGYLEADVEAVHCVVLPAETRQVLRNQINNSIPLGLTIDPNESVTFITHTGREVTTFPVVQNWTALQQQLQQRGLGEVIIEDQGNLRIPLDSQNFFNARPSLCATLVADDKPLGMTETMPVAFVFTDAQGQRWQQFFYPAVVDESALLRKKASYRQNAGYIAVTSENKTYEGWLDYLVTLETAPANDSIQIIEIADANGDGLSDYQIVYPQGATQKIFRVH